MTKYNKGKFKPKNPKKYKGNPTEIYWRSSWELKLMLYLDEHKDVISWGSEEIIIPYRSPLDNRIHRYFVDFQIQIKDKSGSIKTYLVEIKPAKQTVPPVFPGKQTKRYLEESFNFIKNQSKWDAAKQYAKDRNWQFIIITEHELGL